MKAQAQDPCLFSAVAATDGFARPAAMDIAAGVGQQQCFSFVHAAAAATAAAASEAAAAGVTAEERAAADPLKTAVVHASAAPAPAAAAADATAAAAASTTAADCTPKTEAADLTADPPAAVAADPTAAVGAGRVSPTGADDSAAAAAECGAAAAATATPAATEEEEAPASRAGLQVTFASECIDGAQAPLCDALALELAQQLELIVEDNEYLLQAMEEESSASGAAAASPSAAAAAADHTAAAEGPTAAEQRSRRAAANPSGAAAATRSARIEKKTTLPVELEIEGRLGVLLDMETNARLSLPVTSVALLSSSFCPPRPAVAAQQQQRNGGAAAAAPLRFDAGVNEKQFGTLQQLMAAAAASPGAPSSSNSNKSNAETGSAKRQRSQQRQQETAADSAAADAAVSPSRRPLGVDEVDDEGSDWETIYDEALQAAPCPAAAAAGAPSATAAVGSAETADPPLPSRTGGENSSSMSSESGSSSAQRRGTGKECGCVFCAGSERDATALERLRVGSGWEALETQETEEEYHEFPGMSGARIRLSYAHPKQAGAEPQAALWKENLLQWNLYTGKDSGQEWLEEDASWSSSRRGGSSRGGGGSGGRRGVRTLDCRVAVNLEHHVDVAAAAAEVARKSSSFLQAVIAAGEGQKAEKQELLRRIRKRHSFVHAAGLRVDLTQVHVSGGPQSAAKAAAAGNRRRAGAGEPQEEEAVLYEVETELRPQLLLQAVQHKKQTGDAVPLLALCESFLFVLYGLAARLNTAAAAAAAEEQERQQQAAAAAAARGVLALSDSCRPSAAAAALYTEYLSPCLPLLGDYCFRAVAPALHRAGQLPLKNFLQQVNPEQASCYSNDTVSLIGPWVPCVNEQGQLEFAAVTPSGFLQ